MKRIINKCNQIDKTKIYSNEGIKLRLRGKGSGFLEGPEQVESKDPLNLCVSSKNLQKYILASNEVDKLLLKIYQEYKYFDNGKFY